MRTPGRKPVCEFAIVEVQVPSNPQDHFPPGSPACLGYRHASANLQGVNLHHETAPESHRPNRGHLLGACTPLMRNASPHAHHGLPALEQQERRPRRCRAPASDRLRGCRWAGERVS